MHFSFFIVTRSVFASLSLSLSLSLSVCSDKRLLLRIGIERLASGKGLRLRPRGRAREEKCNERLKKTRRVRER